MILKDIIKSNKTVSEYGTWKAGDIPNAQFPTKNSKKTNLSKQWKWRIIKLTCLENDFIVILRLNTEKQKFHSDLALKKEEGYAIICTKELHVSHKNWHCHFLKQNIENAEVGTFGHRKPMVEFPSGKSTSCTVEFDVTELNALQKAAKFYRFDSPSQGELQWT